MASISTTSESAAATTVARKDLRYYSLDIWRGVACLMVVVYHSLFYVTENPEHIRGNFISKNIFSTLSQGWAGVPLFFVISGYCITAACEAMGMQRASMKKYFFRRFKRIFPPYWILLLGVIALHLASEWMHGSDFLADKVIPMTKPAALSAQQWAGNVTLTEGWRDHFTADKSRYFLTHAWSLGYEEQFYALCGILLLLGHTRFYRSLTILSAIVLAVVVVSCTIVPLPTAGFFFDGRWLMFAAGVLVFYVLQFGSERARNRAMILLIAAFLGAFVWGWPGRSHLGKEMAWSFGFAAVLIPLFRRDQQMITSRILRPFAFCGIMCYSLYLIHWPVVKIVTELCYRAGVHGEWSTLFISVPAALAASICAAWIFHRLVELRFMNTPPTLPGLRKPRPVGASELAGAPA